MTCSPTTWTCSVADPSPGAPGGRTSDGPDTRRPEARGGESSRPAEPGTGVERLGTVRPDPRPSPDHAGHDRWLVVRWTTDPADLSPAETAQARDLLAACAECAALSADIELIGRATATSVVPARPRDFRLTPELAASSRGGVLDRLRRWLAAPGSFAVRPLAGAALAIGIMLVVVAPNVGSGVTTRGDGAGVHAQAAPSAMAGPEATQMAKATAPTEGVHGTGPEMDALPAPTGTAGSQANLMTRVEESPRATQPSDTTMAGGRELASPGAAEGQAVPDGTGVDGTTDEPAPDGTAPATGTAAGSPDATTFALQLLGVVLAGTGLMVLVFVWLARRWQDPLLR